MRKLGLIFGIVLAVLSGAASAAELREGQQYTVLRPSQPVDSVNQIEVKEFFWYGCGHCFHLEAPLQKWLKKLPKDVVFHRIPAVFPGRDGAPGPWAAGAKMYYTLEQMGQLERLHGEIFDAVHVDRQTRLVSDDSFILDWVSKKGINARQFADIYNSFSVQSKVRRAMQLTEAHGLDGVPALIVDGRYKPVNGNDGFEDTLAVTDQLIDIVRKDRGSKKK